MPLSYEDELLGQPTTTSVCSPGLAQFFSYTCNHRVRTQEEDGEDLRVFAFPDHASQSIG